MDRRTFLCGLGATVVAMPAISASAGTAAAGERVVPVPERWEPTTQRVWIIGLPAHDKYMVKVKQMSDDIFDRLIAAVSGTSYKVLLDEKVGATYIQREACLTEQWHVGVRMRMDELDYNFPIERFRAETTGWVRGTQWDPHEAQAIRIPAEHAFMAESPGQRYVGMPYLPKGVDFAVHYIDCDTGMVMRAVANFDVNTDGIILRCDVLVG